MRDPAQPVSDAQRAFLQAPRFASLATVDPDGGPRQAVAWYDLLPDGRLLVNSRAGRRWPANLQRDGRVAISVIDVENGESWLGLTAHVDEIVEDVTRAREDICNLAYRYEDGRPSEDTLATFRSQQRITFLLRIEQVHDHLNEG
jgi:PPOX class probable F420-dependent enzyme